MKKFFDLNEPRYLNEADCFRMDEVHSMEVFRILLGPFLMEDLVQKSFHTILQ